MARIIFPITSVPSFSFDLDKYYGLLELGEIGGMWKNVAGRYEMDGKKIYGKDILKDVDKYFTPEVMKSLDEVAQKEFSYG